VTASQPPENKQRSSKTFLVRAVVLTLVFAIAGINAFIVWHAWQAKTEPPPSLRESQRRLAPPLSDVQYPDTKRVAINDGALHPIRRNSSDGLKLDYTKPSLKLPLGCCPNRDVLENIQKSKNIVRIDAHLTHFDDACTPYIANLPLTELDLTHTDITDRSMPVISKIKTLKVLRIGFCPVTGEGLQQIENLRGINDLSLNYLRVKRGDLKFLERLPVLRSLDLYYMPIDDSDLCGLKLENLKTLALHTTNITNAALRSISTLPNLTTLDISHNALNDSTMAELSSLRLQKLGFSNTETSDESLRSIATMKSLKTIAVVHTFVSKTGIDAFHRGLPHCKVINDLQGMQDSVEYHGPHFKYLP